MLCVIVVHIFLTSVIRVSLKEICKNKFQAIFNAIIDMIITDLFSLHTVRT